MHPLLSNYILNPSPVSVLLYPGTMLALCVGDSGMIIGRIVKPDATGTGPHRDDRPHSATEQDRCRSDFGELSGRI